VARREDGRHPDLAHTRRRHPRVTVTSSPPGATVQIRDYLTPDSAWQTLGTTPLDGVRIPRGYLAWRISKPGVGDYVAAPIPEDTMRFALDMAGAAPDGMVPIPARDFWDYIAFVGWVGPYTLPAFYVVGRPLSRGAGRLPRLRRQLVRSVGLRGLCREEPRHLRPVVRDRTGDHGIVRRFP
jgi:hypothetical protein